MDRNSIKQPFWSMNVEEVLRNLETKVEGLSEEEAKKRFLTFGPNEIKDGRHFSGLKLFLDQFKSPLILILIVAGITTFFLKDWVDTGVIFAAVLVNVLLGFYQEAKAENILELLRSYVKTRTRARRNGGEIIIDASQLVPGDIIHLAQGDRIPADGRLIFANDLQVDEAILTGESEPVQKSQGKNLAIAQRLNQ